MKGRERPPIPGDPRGAAKDFIRRQVRAGATLASLLHHYPSSWDERYSATVGGTIWNRRDGKNEYLALEMDQIGGGKLGGEEAGKR